MCSQKTGTRKYFSVRRKHYEAFNSMQSSVKLEEKINHYLVDMRIRFYGLDATILLLYEKSENVMITADEMENKKQDSLLKCKSHYFLQFQNPQINTIRCLMLLLGKFYYSIQYDFASHKLRKLQVWFIAHEAIQSCEHKKVN